MKFPFEFSTKLIFRLILPGAVLAAAFVPLVHWALHFWGFPVKIEYAFPLEVLAWGWLVILSDMRIYMLFEGRRYWHRCVREAFVASERRRLAKLVGVVEYGRPTKRDKGEVELDYSQFPFNDKGDPTAYYPTRLGNLLMCYENYPSLKYGIDGVFYWYRLWLMLDKDTREELDNAQALADSAVYVVFALYVSGVMMFIYAAATWAGSLGSAWLPSIKLPYVPGAGSLVVMGALCFVAGFCLYRITLPIHATFGELFVSVFDQHRSKLSFDDVLNEIGQIRGTPYGRLSKSQSYRIVWRYLRWHLIRDETQQKNFKVKDWLDKK